MQVFIFAGFKVWECEVCKRIFPSEAWLSRHKRYHGRQRDIKALKCGQCLYSTDNSRDLAAHLGTHNGYVLFSNIVEASGKNSNKNSDVEEQNFSVCDKKVTKPDTLYEHQKVNTVQENYFCVMCNYHATDPQDRIDHMKRHSEEILYNCSHCDFKTKDCLAFNEHKTTHSLGEINADSEFNPGLDGRLEKDVNIKEEVETCQLQETLGKSGYKAVCAGALKEQAVRNCREIPCHYTECGNKLAQPEKHLAHVRTHRETIPLSCTGKNWCDQGIHIKTHSMEEQNSNTVCDSKLPEVVDSTVEKNVHEGDELETCKVCGYKAAKIEDLKTHMWKHREKPYACSDCGYRAVSARRLKEHMRSHSREKPNNSSERGYNTALARNKRIHMDKQMGMESYSIAMSNNSTTQGEELKECNRGNNEVKIPCSSQVSDFVDKVGTSDIEKPFCCSGCEYRTAIPDELEAHIQTHLKEQLNNSNVPEYSAVHAGNFFYPTGLYKTSFFDELKDPLRKNMGQEPNSTLTSEHMKDQTQDSLAYIRTQIDKKTHCCTVCSYRTAFADELKAHMRIHIEEEPYSCVCEYKTAQLGDLLVHMGTHIGENPFCCTVCNFRTALADDLRKHIQTHMEVDPESRQVSENKAAQGSDTVVHRTEKSDKPYCCTMCSYRTALANELKEHIRSHSVSNNLTAEQGERAVGAFYYQANISRKPGEKPFSCPVCGFMTATFPRLREHMQVHLYNSSNSSSMSKPEDLRIRGRTPAKVKPYCCTECDYKAAQAGQLKDHMKTHTGEKPFSCTECDFSTIRAGDLKVHMRKHTGEKPYSCTECGYSTTRAGHLSVHMRTHTGEKPYSCKICGYRFAQTSQLKTHMRNHTGEKPYSCTLCDCKFTQAGHLKFHMRTHTGEKPFCCTKCEYRAAQAGDLKEHMRTHTGEKPFSCEVCDYRTARARDLVAHMRKHTGEKPFNCPKCDYKAATAGQVKKHNVRAHAGE